jgi:hypothetical protein
MEGRPGIALARLVHRTPEKNVAKIIRNGIKNVRGVYGVPVLPTSGRAWRARTSVSVWC